MPTTQSPLRYPGGKTKLYPAVKELLQKNYNSGNCIYIEPFAGGAGLALKLLINHDVEKIVLNDIDPGIYAFWYSVLHNVDEFCSLIETCQITLDTWDYQKDIYTNKHLYDQLHVGFSTFFLNRCNVSGIIKGGPIGGREQNGKYLLDARFNKSNLIKKIQTIYSLRDQIELYNLDAKLFLENISPNCSSAKAFFNIDPPYVNKGPSLYKNCFSESDHTLLADTIRNLQHKWIVTYDESELIRHLYNNFRIINYNLQYSAGKAKLGTEVIIYSNDILV